MNKYKLYSLIVVVLIFVILVFSANKLFLSPKLSEKTTVEEVNNNLLLGKKFVESDISFLNDFTSNKLSDNQIVELKDYKIQLEHIDILEDNGLRSLYVYYAVDEKGIKYEIIIPDKRTIDFAEKGFLFKGKIYVEGKIVYDEFAESSPERSITGYQIYNPPTAFNRRNISVAVVAPYNNVTINLSSNYQQFLSTILEGVKNYYLDNSDNTTYFNFTLYPLFNSSYNGNFFINELFSWLDPYVNFSETEFVLIANYNPVYAGGGVATYSYGYNGLNYINTNEGPIIGGYTSVNVDYNFSSYLYTSGYYVKPFAHEIGHYIALFNPQLILNFGMTPHAHGMYDSYDCSQSGTIQICNPYEYGDNLDVMGNGRGYFHEHSRAYYMGLNDVSQIQSVTSSGTYQLCDINSQNSNCPQQLLIQNPNGNNLALELRTEAGHTYYGCPANYFDSILVRATDLEEGGGLNDTYFELPGYIGGGSVIIPYNYSYEICTNFSLLNYGVPVGHSVNLGLGDISIINITTLVNSAKMATVSINYTVPPCYTNAPTLNVSQSPVYYSNLFSTTPLSYSPKIKIKNNDICNVILDSFNMTLEVFIGGNILRNSSIVIISPQQELTLLEFPLPQALNGLQGDFNYTLTVFKTLNVSQSASFSGSGSLIPYTPQIFGPYQLTGCADNDPVQFTLQNLGANFTAYPNNGATVNLTGYSTNLYIPDICLDGVVATDVVCGSNTGYSQLQNQGFIIVKDCRFVLNKPNADCGIGFCS